MLYIGFWRLYSNTVFQKELYNGIPNVTVWRVLWKRSHLKAYKLSIVQGACKVIIETPFITNESRVGP
jgi:hypothetical protein